MNAILKLRTLTPLWTGDIYKNSGEVKETGIIGSLRWWYEGIVRGLGVHACSPVDDDEERKHCSFNMEAYKDALKEGKTIKNALNKGLKQVCPVCRLFGCEGWRKRFRVEVSGIGTLPLFFIAHKNVYVSNGGWLFRIFNGSRKEGRGANVKYYFDSKTLWDDESFLFKIIPTTNSESIDVINDEDVIAMLSFLVKVIADYAGIGAKTQNGFGQIEVVEGLDRNIVERGKRLIMNEVQNYKKGNKAKELLSMERFFSLLFEIKDKAPYRGVEQIIGEPAFPQGFDYRRYFIPCAFDIRYKIRTKNPFTGQGENYGMRPFFKERFGKEIAEFLLGKTQPKHDEDRQASQVNVSHLYRENPSGSFYLKIWGYIPEQDNVSITVDQVVKTIKDYITSDKIFPGSKVLEEFKKEVIFS
jgi:CRISPR-associated protein Cmr1